MNLEKFPPVDPDSGQLCAVIETAKGARNKFKFDAKREAFQLSGVLPAGAVFPFDFGFLPGTQGEDGDPLDILVLMDEPAFAGCIVEARLLGAVAAEQTERDGKTERNDRLIAVAEVSHTHRDVKELADLHPVLLEEIEHFFKSYNDVRGKKFKPKDRLDSGQAWELVNAGVRAYKKENARNRKKKQ